MRPGELLGLCWEDVRGDTVTIRRAVNVLGEETHGKNENAVRAFALSGFSRSVLEQQRAVTGAGDSVFEIKSEGYFYKRWQVYLRANDLPPVSLYSLRHTFVSIVKSLPEGEIKGLVGHSQSMDTFGWYSHELTGDAENTARDVDAKVHQAALAAAEKITHFLFPAHAGCSHTSGTVGRNHVLFPAHAGCSFNTLFNTLLKRLGRKRVPGQKFIQRFSV